MDVMGIRSKNVTRATKKLVAEHKFIYIEQRGNLVFLAFQFGKHGQIYPELLKAVPLLIEYEISHEDFCFWLTDETSEVLHVKKDGSYEVSGESFEDMMKRAAKASNENIVYQSKPIDTSIKGDVNIFNDLFSIWTGSERLLHPLKMSHVTNQVIINSYPEF